MGHCLPLDTIPLKETLLLAGLVFFSVKAQIVNTLGFVDYPVSVSSTQFYHWNVKASRR